jgi:hypothetical protein
MAAGGVVVWGGLVRIRSNVHGELCKEGSISLDFWGYCLRLFAGCAAVYVVSSGPCHSRTDRRTSCRSVSVIVVVYRGALAIAIEARTSPFPGIPAIGTVPKPGSSPLGLLMSHS